MLLRDSGTDGMMHVPDSDGNPNVFNLEHDDDGMWLNSNWYNPDDGVDHDNLWFARLRNFRYFSLDFISGEFCFVSCPFHPPSILPTSSSFSERCIYFLSSKDFVSHKIIRRTFMVSVFRIARRTHGCFSVLSKNVATEIASIISTKSVSILIPSE